jgi:hypothetical protein
LSLHTLNFVAASPPSSIADRYRPFGGVVAAWVLARTCRAAWDKEPVELGRIDEAGVKKLAANDSKKLRVINVWMTSCGPCVAEIPLCDHLPLDDNRGDRRNQVLRDLRPAALPVVLAVAELVVGLGAGQSSW